MWRRSRLSLLMITVVLAGCAAPTVPAGQSPTSGQTAAAPQAPAAPKKMTIAVAGDPHTLYQKFNPSSTVRGVEELEQLVNTGLSVLDKGGNLEARLAEQVPSLENGLWQVFPDGRMETTWKIRPGAVWHDGTPVTANDAVFAARFGRDRELPLSRHRSYNFVDRIEAVDDRTVTVYWTQPYTEADRMFGPEAALPVPSHLLEQAYQTDKQSFPQLPYWTEEFVGAGPFRLTEFVRGSHMILTANDRYVLGRPRLDTIEVRFIVDPNTMIANVLAGAVDATIGRGTSFEQALQIKDQWRDGAPEMAVSSHVQMFPQFINPSPAVLGNVQFRKALMYGINRQEMVDTIQYGYVPVSHIFVSPDEPEYPHIVNSLVKYDFEPRRAMQMIEALGYTRAGDGIYRDSAGQRLSVEIRATGTDINQKSMFAIAGYWQQIGVAVEQVAVPPQRASDLEYRATFPGFAVQRKGGEMSYVGSFHTTQLRIPENRYAGSNNPRYSNPELDALIDRFETTIDRNERYRVAAEAARHVTDQLVEFPLFYDVQPALIGNRVVNLEASRGASTSAWNAHLWDTR